MASLSVGSNCSVRSHHVLLTIVANPDDSSGCLVVCLVYLVLAYLCVELIQCACGLSDSSLGYE